MAAGPDSSKSEKATGAFRTIGEVSRDLAIPQHILRYWETRFTELSPLQRAGRRRYYRPDDVALLRRIDALLNRDGYTIKGVQKLLSSEGVRPSSSTDIGALRAIRDVLSRALSNDAF